MSLTFGFYSSLKGDRRYTAEQLSSIFSGVINDGVFMSIGNRLMVSASDEMTVIVGSGRAWFNGTWTDNDSEYLVTIPASELVLNRIDAIVLEINSNEHVRANSVKVVTGTPATNPSRPTLTNDANVHQYPLAYVTVNAGTTAITQSAISNAVGTSECPWVTGILKTIDTDELVVQWTTRFDEMFRQLEEAIEQTLAAEVVDGSITTPKIVNNAVTADKISPDGVVEKIGAAPLDYAKKVGNPRNLLINSDFLNPVNQRGIVSGEIAIEWSYIIDCWRMSHAGILEFGENGLYVEQTITQSVYEVSKYAGKIMTAAVKLVGGTIYLLNFTPQIVSSWTSFGARDWGEGQIQMSSDASGRLTFNLRGRDILWAALYEGEYTPDTLPEYQSRGYETELLLCGQYDPTTGAYIGLRKFGGAKNLLDNSDFRNPVQQAGRGGLHGAQAYAIDRWVLTPGANAWGNLGDDLVIISDKTRWTAGISQRLDSTLFARDKAYTLAFYGYIPNNVRLYVYGSDDTNLGVRHFVGSAEWKVYIITVTIPSTFTGNYIDFSISTDANTTGNTAYLRWAALYEGEYTLDTLPEYQPKGYAAELAECQRYYLHNVGQFLSGSFMANSNSFRATVPIPAPMRVNPTVTLVNGDSIIWAYGGQSRTTKVTGVSEPLVYPYGIVVNLLTEDNPGAYVSGHTFTTTLCLSADL